MIFVLPSQLYQKAISLPKERQWRSAKDAVPYRQVLNDTWDPTWHSSPPDQTGVKEDRTTTKHLIPNLDQQWVACSWPWWAVWPDQDMSFGPCCKFLSVFGVGCYRPSKDDATLARVAMLSAPFPDIFPGVGVTFTVKCHRTQSYGSDYYGK